MSSQVNVQATLQSGFVSRPISMDELEEIVDLLGVYWEQLVGMRKFTIDDIRGYMTMPGFDIETSTRVVLAPDGQIVGFIVAIALGTPPVHPIVSGCVHPDFEGQGIGTFLMEWAEERARQAVARVPDDLRVSMQLNASSAHEPTKRLLERQGLNAIRHSLLMVTDLDEAPPVPKWPDGLVVRTYQDYSDLEVVCRTVDETFQDHWGHVGSPIEDMVQRWQHRIENDKGFDPSLWFLVMDDNEVAAIALCEPRVGDNPEMGLVDALGGATSLATQGVGNGAVTPRLW